MNRQLAFARQSDSCEEASEALTAWYFRTLFLGVLVVILTLGNAHVAFADTHTWDGGSMDNSDWSSAENWAGDVAPVSGDSVAFAGDVQTFNGNDIADLSLASVSFTQTDFRISGLPVTLTGGMIQSNATYLNEWSIDTSLPAGIHTFTGDQADLTLFGVISGAGSVHVDGNGAVGFGGLNTFAGGTAVVDNGWLFLRRNDAIPHGDGKGGLSIDTEATLDLNTYSATINSLSGDGRIGVDAYASDPPPANTLTVGDGSDSEFSGVIDDGRAILSVVKVGSGTLKLSGPCSYTGATSVNAGTLLIGGAGSTSATSAVAIQPGAVLGGSGSASGTVTVRGTVAPGSVEASVGTLHTGSETWAEGGSYAFQVLTVDGTAGSSWDLLDITGDLTVAASAEDPFTIGLGSVGNLSDFDPSHPYTWRIARFTGESNGFDSSKFAVSTKGFDPGLAGGAFSVVLADSGQAVNLVFTPAVVDHVVHFNTDGTIGSSVSSMTQTVAGGGDAQPVTAIVPTGYRFVNWTGTGSFETTTANPVTVSNVTAEMTVTANFAADRPAAPYSVTWSPVKGGTLIQWAGSPGATGYQVWLGAPPQELGALGRWNPGRLLGTTGPSTCYLFVPEYLGPNASIYVVALGDETSSSPGVGVYTAAVTPVQFGTVRFTGNSSRLTPATKRALRRYASLMATQGFKSVNVSGYTAKFDHGSASFRRRLSLTRAKNVKAYLAAQFKALHVSVSINAAGYGGTRPVASNRTKAGAAKNRRAEVLLR
jgi:uncharacterized repeat protein (TIGR02543 family)